MSLADSENDVAEVSASRRKACLGLACLMALVFLGQAVSSESDPRVFNDRPGHLALYVAVSVTVALAIYFRWDIGLLGMLAASGIGASFKTVHIDHLVSTTASAFAGLGVGLVVGTMLRGSVSRSWEAFVEC